MIMCEWTLADIKNKASNKAFAKQTILKLDIEDYKRSFKQGTYGESLTKKLNKYLMATKQSYKYGII